MRFIFEDGYLRTAPNFGVLPPPQIGWSLAASERPRRVRLPILESSRFVFRLSGTGVAGATIRMYLEKYASPSEDLGLDAFDVVKPIADIALSISKLSEFTGRTEPTVIT